LIAIWRACSAGLVALSVVTSPDVSGWNYHDRYRVRFDRQMH
jgi:hypothetical protein